MIRYVPVDRAMAGVREWLEQQLAATGSLKPIRNTDPREAYWLPDGRLLSEEETQGLSRFEFDYALPVRAAVLEFEGEVQA